MRFAFYDYGGKGARLRAALEAAGHEEHPAASLGIVDHEVQPFGDKPRVVQYPHGGSPVLAWDGDRTVRDNVRLVLTHGPGQAAVAGIYGHPAPHFPVGWMFSELAEPRYPGNVTSVLFAPSHPLTNGRIEARLLDVNRRAFDALLELGVEVRVRLFGSPCEHGLYPTDKVQWVPGGGLWHDDIDAAQLVVADSTVAHLAVARGVPLIYLGSDAPPELADNGPHVYPAHWDRYADLVRYPYDVDDGPLEKLIGAVCQPDERVDLWRRRFIGGPFDGDLAVRLIEDVALR